VPSKKKRKHLFFYSCMLDAPVERILFFSLVRYRSILYLSVCVQLLSRPPPCFTFLSLPLTLPVPRAFSSSQGDLFAVTTSINISALVDVTGPTTTNNSTIDRKLLSSLTACCTACNRSANIRQHTPKKTRVFIGNNATSENLETRRSHKGCNSAAHSTPASLCLAFRSRRNAVVFVCANYFLISIGKTCALARYTFTGCDLVGSSQD
jgi:hypothetical protein